jgi:hypothetical protein
MAARDGPPWLCETSRDRSISRIQKKDREDGMRCTKGTRDAETNAEGRYHDLFADAPGLACTLGKAERSARETGIGTFMHLRGYLLRIVKETETQIVA